MVIVICLGCYLNTTLASESADILELTYGNLWPEGSMFISRAKFTQLITSRVSEIENVFNISKMNGIISDGITFSVLINGNTYNNIQCDIKVYFKKMVYFNDCVSDAVAFQDMGILVNYAEISAPDVVIDQ